MRVKASLSSDGDQQDLPSVYSKESSMPLVAGLGYDLSNFPLLPKPIIELGSPKSGFRPPSELHPDRVDTRLDENGATSKDQWTRVADQPKVGVLSDSTTTEGDQRDDHPCKGHVEDHPSVKNNLPNENLVQDQPPASQPNFPETTFRFGAVGDGAKRANLAPPKLKVQPYGERSIIYHSYYEEQGLGLSNLWVRVTASLKDNLSNEDLLQDQPPAFQPN